MRGIFRQQREAGRCEHEVMQYFEPRYGDRILLSPPSQGFTALAWLVPIALLLGGALLLFFVLRGWHAQSVRASLEGNDTEPEGIDENEMQYYQRQLEQELAVEDPIFAQPGTEAN